jgi:hypothetical protein
MSGADAVIQGLLKRGVPAAVAYGIAGNMQIESDGFKTDVNEYAPLVPGSRGGYGLNQWTGPRRRQFESFAADRGVNAADLDTQLDFTLWELSNTEKRAGQALMTAQSPAEAAQIYSEKFLRPGIPHLERRIAAANGLAGGQTGRPTQAPQGGYAGQQQPQNQLAGVAPTEQPQAPEFKMQNTLQDARAFQMQPQNQLAQGGFGAASNPFLSHLRTA